MDDIEQTTKTEPETSTGLTIFQGIIIFVTLVIGMIIIIYVIRNSESVLYPLSPFNFGDTVIITPVVLSQYGTGSQIIPTNQYLTANFQGNTSCISNSLMNSGACTVTFTGDPTSESSQWILNQFFPSTIAANDPTTGMDPKSDANQSLNTGGFGNRFYLQNKTQNANNPAGRVRFSPFNGPVFGTTFKQPWETIPVIGSTYTYQSIESPYYFQDLLVYFMPTNYPDIYYILFPGEATTNQPFGVFQAYNNNLGNDGIASVRPYADVSGNSDLGYFPFFSNGNLTPNGPLMGRLPTNQNDPKQAFSNPEIFLFRVTKV